MKEYTNYFAKQHPIAQLIYFLSVFFLVITISNPAFRIAGIVIFMFYILFFNGIKKLFKSLFYMIPLLLLIAIINPLFIHKGNTILFYLNDNPITFEAFFYGLLSAVLIINLIWFFVLFSSCIDNHKLVYLFGKKFPAFSLMITMVLRYMPSINRDLKELTGVQQTFGVVTTSGTLTKRFKNGSNFLLSLISISLEKSIDTSDSMNARGYNLKKKTNYLSYSWQTLDILIIIISLTIDIILAALLAFGYARYSYYPEITQFIPTYFDLAALILFSLIIALPLIINFLKELQWKYITSKN